MATLQNLNFVPTSIAGCSLWLDAADRNTITTSAGSITQWNDKSGSNNNATSPAGPTVSTYNGYPTITFNGSSQYMNSANTVPLTTHTLIMIHRPAVINGNLQGNTSLFRYQLTSPFIVFPYMNNTIPRGYITSADGTGVGSIDATNSTLVENSVTTAFNIIIAVIQSGNQQIFKNGSLQSSNTQVLSGGTSPALSIGRNVIGNSEFYQGDLGEMIVFPTALSTSNRQTIEGYLAWKWGLQGNLPSTHPFKNIAPNSAGLTYPSALTVAVPTQTIAVNPAPFVFNFSPTSVSGCQLWLDAFDRNAVVLGAGSNITRVIDKSPQNLTLTNAVSFTYDATNRAFVGPGGSGPVLGTVAFSLATPACMFIVGQLTFGYFFDGLTATRRMGSLWNGSQYIGTTIDTTFVYPTLASNPYSTRSVFETVFNGASSLLYRNGTVVQTPSLGSPTITGLVIGSRYTLTEEALQGTINELIVYNSELATTQRQLIEGYLAWKWGLQTSLPSNHPYRNAVPGQSITVPIPLITFQSASFRPTQISGCRLWLDGQDPLNTGAQPANSATVVTWVDKSGSGNNATTSTGTITYSGSGLTFSGTQAMATTLSSVLTSQSVFVIASANSASTIDIVSVESASGGTGVILRLANYVQDFVRLGGTLIASGGTVTTSTRFLYNTTYISGGFSFVYLNGSQTGANSSSTTISGTGTVLIGAYRLGGGYGEFYSGIINEILIYNTILTTAQRQSVEGYLAWKWGLVGSLPATHPFKRFPPPPS